MGKKKCCYCKQEKELSEFSKDIHSKDLLQNRCKDCQKEINRIYRDKIRSLLPKKYVPPEGYKICPRCKQELPISDFYTKVDSNDGYCSYCKNCSKETAMESCTRYKEGVAPRKKNGYRLKDGKKICAICLEEKNEDEFYKDKNSKDGISRKCKECEKQYYGKFYSNKLSLIPPQKPMPKEGYKFCSCCGEEKELDEFQKRSNGKDGYYCVCRVCVRKRNARLRKNPLSLEKSRRCWFKRRTAISNKINDLTYEQELKILKNQDFKCSYCGKDLKETKFHRDHIIPVQPALVGIYQIDGGYNSASNIQMLCQSCNASKGNRLDKKGGVKMLVDLLAVVAINK